VKLVRLVSQDIRSELISKDLTTLISQLQKYKEQGWESFSADTDTDYSLMRWELETDEAYLLRTNKNSRYEMYLQLKKEFESHEIPHC
jgi:hypothetical protein